MLRFTRVDYVEAPWTELDRFVDRSVFQSREWLNFLVASQGGEPVLLRLERDGEAVGWFTGLIVSRFGIRILGSPFQGWTTGPMGLNLLPGIDRVEAVAELFDFAFSQLRCLHVEIMDRHLNFGQLDGLKAEPSPFETFEIDLRPNADEIFAAMSSACRRAVRKSQKSGVRVERASGIEFADEYFDQLIDVFAKQSMKPPYKVERVRQLIRNVGEDRLLLLRALDSESRSVATGIFPYFGDYAYFWGGASWREHQILRPNEALFWHAMQELKDKGVTNFDLGRGGDHKRKYGVRSVTRPFIRRSRYSGLLTLRNTAAKMGWWWVTKRQNVGRHKSKN